MVIERHPAGWRVVATAAEGEQGVQEARASQPDLAPPTAPRDAASLGLAGASAPVDAQWWRAFGDTQLDRLVDQAIALTRLVCVVFAVWGACAIARRMFSRDADFISQLLLAGYNHVTQVVAPGEIRVGDRLSGEAVGSAGLDRHRRRRSC